MKLSSMKMKKGKSGCEDRPEFRNLIDSLDLLKDFGYSSLWLNDEEFVKSFNVGGQCPKYIELLKFLEKNLETFCKSSDLALHKATIGYLKASKFMQQPPDRVVNPVMFRLNTTNDLVNNLLQYCLKDLNNPQSKALKFLYSNSCGGLNVVSGTKSQSVGGTRTSGCTASGSKHHHLTKTKKTELSAARLARLTQLAQQIHPTADGLDLVFECELNISDEETEGA